VRPYKLPNQLNEKPLAAGSFRPEKRGADRDTIGESAMSLTAETPTPVKDALENARVAAQDLHRALSDAAAKRGGAIKADLEAVPLKVKAIAASITASLDAQNAAAKNSLGEAVSYLEATGTHAADALKTSGHAALASIQHAVSDARASVQKISEAVAEKRSPASAMPIKK
jgi:hypothetical protein